MKTYISLISSQLQAIWRTLVKIRSRPRLKYHGLVCSNTAEDRTVCVSKINRAVNDSQEDTVASEILALSDSNGYLE